MNEWWKQAITVDVRQPPSLLVARLLLAFVFGWMVAFVYKRMPRAEAYAPTFPPTLVLLCLLIATVTQVIGDNVARAFSLVGALSIVRFRTVVQDTQDTAFVIFAVIIGMAVGADHLWVALISLIITGAAAFVIQPRGLSAIAPTVDAPNAYKVTLRVQLSLPPERIAETLLAPFVVRAELMTMATVKQGATLEAVYQVVLREGTTPEALVDNLNREEGITNVDLRRYA